MSKEHKQIIAEKKEENLAEYSPPTGDVLQIAKCEDNSDGISEVDNRDTLSQKFNYDVLEAVHSAITTSDEVKLEKSPYENDIEV